MQDLALDNSSNPSAAISYGWNIAAEIGVGKKIRQENRIICESVRRDAKTSAPRSQITPRRESYLDNTLRFAISFPKVARVGLGSLLARGRHQKS